jgi:capsular polysaccharide export protein
LLDRLEGPLLTWVDAEPAAPSRDGFVWGRCDPWHLVSGATAVFTDDDELAVIATLAGLAVHGADGNAIGAIALRDRIRARLLGPDAYANPFTGEAMTLSSAIALCAHWRQLIDANRPIVAAIGFAPWKRRTVAPLLWAGSADVPFATRPRSIAKGDHVAAWKSRVPATTLTQLEGEGAQLIEVEDGFIRSVGLGADCVPPLSLVVDRLGAFFNPQHPSELENLLEHGKFPPELTERARRLRQLIVDAGVSKYATGQQPTQHRAGDRRHVLVPGQVEDDRSVLCGGGEVTTNLELLRRVRAAEPNAFILYKPHPDVEAGHRVGAILDELSAQFADEVVRDQPITSLIEMVDEVHVNTSLAGFEALMRNKPVTTHGVPFYAGWGLTRDLGAVPDRRTATRMLDELVAAVLLLYPRYLDPVTGLPCPPEILIRRIAEGAGARSAGPLVPLRRLQGLMKRRLASLRAW